MKDIYPIYVFFSKKGIMKFISHLDLVRLFQRAIRRSGLPFVLTKGYNPRPKISFKRALKLGVESEQEEMVFFLKEAVEPKEVKLRLQTQLPKGLEIIQCKSRY